MYDLKGCNAGMFVRKIFFIKVVKERSTKIMDNCIDAVKHKII
ncbi:hypothetical protein [Deferribacter abyssi]